jgi:thiol-disulfide isomerase/thioredoxin
MPIPLDKQESYEELWFAKSDTAPPVWLILFTARWCKPCERLDKELLEVATDARGIPFYICNASVNKYTPVYCDITRFPTFQIMRPGQVIASLTSSDTATVLDWIKSTPF